MNAAIVADVAAATFADYFVALVLRRTLPKRSHPARVQTCLAQLAGFSL